MTENPAPDLETLLRNAQDRLRGGPELPEIDRRSWTERLNDSMDGVTTWAAALAIGAAVVAWMVIVGCAATLTIHAMMRAVLS